MGRKPKKMGNKTVVKTTDVSDDKQKSGFKKVIEAMGISKPAAMQFRVGMRMFKTSLAIFLTAIFYMVIGRASSSLFLAVIAAIVSMQDTTKNSLRFGMQRLFGTSIGGMLGILFLVVFGFFSVRDNQIVYALCLALASLAAISLCAWLNLRQATTMALVVLIAILLSEEVSDSFSYALNRILDTAIGVVISIAINLTIRPPKWE